MKNHFPSVREQVELCRNIASQLVANDNVKSKGATMVSIEMWEQQAFHIIFSSGSSSKESRKPTPGKFPLSIRRRLNPSKMKMKTRWDKSWQRLSSTEMKVSRVSRVRQTVVSQRHKLYKSILSTPLEHLSIVRELWLSRIHFSTELLWIPSLSSVVCEIIVHHCESHHHLCLVCLSSSCRRISNPQPFSRTGS